MISWRIYLIVASARALADSSKWSDTASSASRDVIGVEDVTQGIESLGSRPDQLRSSEPIEGVQMNERSFSQDLAQFDMVGHSHKCSTKIQRTTF